MTIRSIVGTWSVTALALVCLGSAVAVPAVQAQRPRAADRAAKQALKLSAPRRRGAAQGIRQTQRPRVPRAAARRGMRNPGLGVIERLMRMPANQRRRFLRNNPRFQRLPKSEQQRIQRRLQQFSRMTRHQRELLLQRYELFRRLSPQKQQQARGIYQRWRRIPSNRRQELLHEFQRLRQASPEARQQRFAAKEFAGNYSDSEQKLLKDLSDLLPRQEKD